MARLRGRSSERPRRAAGGWRKAFKKKAKGKERSRPFKMSNEFRHLFLSAPSLLHLRPGESPPGVDPSSSPPFFLSTPSTDLLCAKRASRPLASVPWPRRAASSSMKFSLHLDLIPSPRPGRWRPIPKPHPGEAPFASKTQEAGGEGRGHLVSPPRMSPGRLPPRQPQPSWPSRSPGGSGKGIRPQSPPSARRRRLRAGPLPVARSKKS